MPSLKMKYTPFQFIFCKAGSEDDESLKEKHGEKARKQEVLDYSRIVDRIKVAENSQKDEIKNKFRSLVIIDELGGHINSEKPQTTL